MKKKIRWGILGPGKIARDFAADFKAVDNAVLHAVASSDPQRAHAFAQEYDIPKVYNSYEALYQAEDVDIIYIATPHVFHKEQSIKALQSGKAVLCEKPITTNLGDCQEVTKVAQETGQYLMEGMWTYLLPAFQKAQQWVDEGHIGEVIHLKSEFGFHVPFEPNGRMYNPELGGGALLDLGVYNIAMAWWFFRRDPDLIEAKQLLAPSGVDQDLLMTFHYGKATASLHTSFLCKLPNYTYIIGEKGYIALPDVWNVREAFLYQGESLVEHFQDQRTTFGYNYEIEAVSQELLEGRKESSVMPQAFSLKLQTYMDEVRRVAKNY
ncbi:Gfo/Idh/MocA family oxidoreductase [Algivirga pacifica]|uniref:Gfo/Idh/MocA family oxidoreductase n=1 Tax=Algivirga pacifica TaxID=1162670 RepID=A0ABP9D1Z0_9BACT